MKYSSIQYAKALRALVEENPRERRESVRQFAQTLASQNALSLLPDIIREYESEKLRIRQVARARVYTPARESKTAWERTLGRGVEAEVLQDVRLRGGVVLERGNVRVDNSIKTRMERLKEALLK